MLRTYSNTITATSGNAIVFNTNKILTRSDVSHTANSSNIVVNNPGYYLVTLNLSSTIGTTGEVSIQLYADGVAIPDAIITTNMTAGEYTNGTFNTIIKASPGSTNQTVTLTVVPTADLTIANISFGINKMP